MSPGADGVTTEMLKAGGEEAVEWLYQICNQVWTSVFPEDWKDGTVICIPKKGNPAECDSWRGVTLLSVLGTFYCQILLN